MTEPHLPLNCPHCGRSMRYVTSDSGFHPVLKTDPPAPPSVHVCECPVHGLFHFGPGQDLTRGAPPSNDSRQVEPLTPEH